MPKLRDSGCWIIFTLFIAGATLLLRPSPVRADQLLDVRIGEYDGYTRIVFEVDTPSAQPRIEIGAKGRLWVVFDHTAVNLVRKIPVERSRHIHDVQFWQYDDHLSTSLKVDYAQYRVKTFSLTSPPRVAVDIFPDEPYAGDSQAPLRTAESPAKPSPETPIEDNVPQPTSEQEPEDQAKPSEPLPSEAVEIAQSRPADTIILDDEAKPQKPIARASDPDKEFMSPPTQSTPQTVFRLQFFLIIGLVVITIGILILLLMLLFARHRFFKVKSRLLANDFLQEQEKKIEAINGRIKEQLERYEKA